MKIKKDFYGIAGKVWFVGCENDFFIISMDDFAHCSEAEAMQKTNRVRDCLTVRRYREAKNTENFLEHRKQARQYLQSLNMGPIETGIASCGECCIG